jgi:hypothetical protein
MSSSAKLAIPRSGVQKLDLINGLPDPRQEITFAAWQTPEKGTPKRVVVRIDGHITNQLTDDGDFQAGWPCGVVNVRYTIGGYVKNVLIDATNQSGLVLWAESVDVTAVWDTRRITRLSNNNACIGQQVAASISACECGDTGAADARWLDVLALDATTGSSESPPTFFDWSIHPIPPGARGLRFLDALVGQLTFSVPSATVNIVWSADTFDNYPGGFIQANTNGATDTSILIAPPCAKFLFISFLHGGNFFSNLDCPTFIEWIIAPSTLPGF